MPREPFAQTWLGIALQLFVTGVLAYLTWVMWTRGIGP